MVSVIELTEEDEVMNDYIIKYFLWCNNLSNLFPPEDDPEGMETDGISETAIPSIVELIIQEGFNLTDGFYTITQWGEECDENQHVLDIYTFSDEHFNKMRRDISRFLQIDTDQNTDKRKVFNLYACACVRNPNWMDLNNVIRTRSDYQIICVSNTGQVTDQNNIPIVFCSCE